jgi:formylglycine-generating enzyme required for sulfatase activity
MAEPPTSAVSTGGGAYIGGNVDTGGGEIIGRDKITNTHNVTIIVKTIEEGVEAETQLRQSSSGMVERQPFEPKMIAVPAGLFLMGSQLGVDIPTYETPQHQVTLAAYAIGKYPVTNAQYAEFVRQTGHPVAPASVQPLAGQEQYPVVGVSWDDAVAYCLCAL